MRYELHRPMKRQSFLRRSRPLMTLLLIGSLIGLGAGVANWRSSADTSEELARRNGWQRQKAEKTRANRYNSDKEVRKDYVRKITQTTPTTPATAPTFPVSIPGSPVATSPSPSPSPIPTPSPVTNTASNPSAIPLLPDTIDHREYMHGLDFVKLGGRDMVVFSANNYPVTSPKDEWMHDIFYSYVDPADPKGSFSAKPLVAAKLAQEPASAAVNSAGRMLVTSEDAQFSEYLDQTYGIWDKDLKATTGYGAKLMPPQGGHSGHVAASGDKFLVSFSDGWVDKGGVDNMGTGDDVFARIVNNDGTTGTMINTAVGKNNRDWWPIVAGSDSNWLQVWQRYRTAGSGGGTVMGAIIDHSGKIVKQLSIFANNKYYYHDVQYIPALEMYLVVGSQNTSSNSGVAVLIDKAGNIVSTKTGLPSTNRESQTVISDDGKTAVYPVPGAGATVLDLTKDGVTLRKTISVKWNWDYMGSDGIFTADNRVVIATGSQQGVKFITVDL